MRVEQALRFLYNEAKKMGLTHGKCMSLRGQFGRAYNYVCAPDRGDADWQDTNDATLRGNVLCMRLGEKNLRATFHDKSGQNVSGSKRAHRKTGVSVDFPFVKEL